MKHLGQLLVGLVSALGSLMLVVGALLLSLAEGQVNGASRLPSETYTTGPSATLPPGVTPLPPTPTSTPQPEASSCPAPAGWIPYTVAAGDTLEALAARVNLPAEQLSEANCLISASLLPGTILYLPYSDPSATPQEASPTPPPALPTLPPTATRQPCGPPAGWVLYTVQPNDNLFRLSQAYGVSVAQLRAANCLAGDLIQAGMRLYVPNVPTRTPVFSLTPTPAPSDTAPAITPTFTDTLPVPTDTTVPTDTNTPTPADAETNTPTPTDTFTPQPASENTGTSTPTVTSTTS